MIRGVRETRFDCTNSFKLFKDILYYHHSPAACQCDTLLQERDICRRRFTVRGTDAAVSSNILQLYRKTIPIAKCRHIKAVKTYLSFILVSKERYCHRNTHPVNWLNKLGPTYHVAPHNYRRRTPLYGSHQAYSL